MSSRILALFVICCLVYTGAAKQQDGLDILSQVQEIKKAADITDAVVPSKIGWIIYINKGGETEELDQVAKDLEGLARIGCIDTDNENAEEILKLMKMEGKTAPFYVMFKHGEGKEPEDVEYFEDIEEAKTALKATASDTGIILMDGTEEDLGKFIQASVFSKVAPLILFVEQDEPEIPPLGYKLAMWWNEHFTIGIWPNPEKKFRQQFQIDKLPFVALMIPQFDKAGKFENLGMIRYNRQELGGVKFRNMMTFLSGAKQELDKQGFFNTKDKAEAKAEKVAKDKAAKNRKVPLQPMFEITAATPGACDESKLGMCLVLFTDGSPQNQAKRAEQIALIEAIQRLPSNKGRPLHFMWVDSTCHPEFGQVFDISPDMSPAVVAISPKKLRFARHVGSFTQDAVADFLSGVLGGQKKILPFSKMPQISPDAKPCKDIHAAQTQAPAQEEEFDLDSIMAESIEEEGAKRGKVSVEADVEDPDLEAKKRRAEEEIAKLNKKSKSKPIGTKKKAPAKPTKKEL